MIKKIFLLFIAVMTLSACTSAETPEILFYRYCDFNDGSGGASITFADKNGNMVYSEDPSVTSLPLAELISKYTSGQLAEKIEIRSQCDAAVLADNHRRFCSALKGDHGIEIPEVLPAAETRMENWYGVSLKNGNLNSVLIHQYNRATELYSSSEELNEVYKAFQKGFR